MRNPLLLHRTQTAIGAEVAVHPGSRLELAIRDPPCCGFDSTPGSQQLGFAADGDDRDILFHVMENQRADRVSPFLPGSDCIEGQLQALVSIFLIAGLAGLVVDDSHAAIGTAVDTIDTADHRGLAYSNLERLF